MTVWDDEVRPPAPAGGQDVLGSVGLLLNIGGVIAGALWLSMVGGGYHGGSPALAGAATVLLFGASLACFTGP